MDTIAPTEPQQVEDAVRWAIGAERPLAVRGSGTMDAVGRLSDGDVTLDISGLRGITLYEPEELVLSARAGTRLADIEAAVAAHGQQLAFEPMDPGPLLGVAAGQGTLGGAIAANLSGPRRIAAGAARDHLLGLSAVSGRGEVFKTGGRVVKNVTGYDLCKLIAGSWGTLAVMTDVTLKVLPKPETEATVAIAGLGDPDAIAAMAAALNSQCAVSGAAHLPAEAARAVPMADAIASGEALTVLRLEGIAESVSHRQQQLTELFGVYGDAVSISEVASRAIWSAIRDATPFAASRCGADRPLWRIATAPAQGPDLVRRIGARMDVVSFYDWGGGLIWLMPGANQPDAGAAIVRHELAGLGGHATLIRAPEAIRAAVPVFQPMPAALAALNMRVKDAFDPRRILNRGRMRDES